jgi:HK97 family phage portal protein
MSSQRSQEPDAARLMRTYGSVGTLFAIVDKITTGVAEVNWHLYRGVPSTEDPDPSTEVLVHPALDLWDHPNPFQTQHDFTESFQQHLDLVGEAWWLVGRTAGYSMPLELWVVRPDMMEPIESPTEFISGYLYKNGPVPERKELTDVVFMKRPNPLDPYRGLGPVQSILVDIDSDYYSALWNRNRFFNGAEPGGLLQVDRTLSDDERETLIRTWGESHRGVANADRVGLLENGVQWVGRQYTQKDMQFTELRNLSGERIREAFAFPKPLLGTTVDVNKANAESAEVFFARHIVRPRLEKIKQALNERLLPLYGASGAGLYFAYENPVPDDEMQEITTKKMLADALAVLLGAGISLADACDYLDLPDDWELEEKPAPIIVAPPPPAATPGPGAEGGEPVQNKVDAIKAVSKRIERNWGKRLDNERRALERHLEP